MDLQLQNKLTLVTGSTAGIGRAIAAKFYHLGAHVLVNGRSLETITKAIAQIRDEPAPAGAISGGELIPAVGDFSNKEGVAGIVKLVTEELKRPLDILVNNVGIFEAKSFFEIEDEEWLRFFNVNVLSGVRLVRAFLPSMLERNSGKIITISSEAGLCPKDFMIHYSTTKTAQISISRGLAELTKGTNVRINTVLPGPTWTEGVEEYIRGLAKQQGKGEEETKSDYFKSVEPTSLLGRFIQPEEIANTVAFLASDISACVSGTAVRAEGGIIRHI
eukprot:TRINITY_DN3922_c0_g1_i2.p1 TRINITY_DN3922_c0_g1~~TRINITY_DN3922_c0_g1_i2.p1  ORF type:complete len:288 (+),score=62.75 TRINITY_DN3922_c0_g1_i2:41-865(+)